MEKKLIIDKLKERLFNGEIASRTDSHRRVLNELVEIFQDLGFTTKKEKETIFNSISVHKSIKTQKRGFIDFYAKKGDFVVAVEFDSGARLKYKSIEKLIQSEANLCIGITFGSLTGKKVVKENLIRISSRKEFLMESKKDFWLVVILEKKVRSIQF